MNVTAAAKFGGRLLLDSAVIVAASVVVLVFQPHATVSIIYPATGLALAVLWMRGWTALPVVALVHFALSIRAANSIEVALLVALIETSLAAGLMATLRQRRVTPELPAIRDVATFVVAAFAWTTLGGVLAAIGQYVTESHDLEVVATNALYFWMSDFVSILIFAPLVATWRRWPFARREEFRNWLLLWILLSVLGGAIAFAGASGPTALFLLLPIVVFTSIASGIAGASSSGATLLVVLLALELRHPGAQFDPLIRTLFVGIAAATGYVLGAIWNEKEQSTRRLQFLAGHDTLTGLRNRFSVESQLAALEASPPESHALLYLDLDQFKLVNDTCGHVAGDRMLKELAGALAAATPREASLARLGGDEFACILPLATHAAARATADALTDAVAAYRFRADGMSFAVGVSIGITLFPAGPNDTADAILGRADVACYMAKDEGRHRSHIYLPNDEVMLRRHSAIQQASQLEFALQAGKFRLHVQPIVDLARRGEAPRFFEVLLRLFDEGGVRSPAEFLPIAQQYGLMHQLDRWVFDSVCARLAALGDPTIRLSINVSGSTLNERAFIDHVIAAPAQFGFLPSQVCLEVTESVMIHRLREAVDGMHALRSIGFDLALDDFGAGVASFAYLQELPVTYVKLDGRFVRELASDPASEIIIDSLARLAAIRGITCIAEWVESEESIEPLQRLGVRYAQGFHLGRPVPFEEMAALSATATATPSSQGEPARVPKTFG